MVTAIRGWNDGGEAASIAVRYLIERWEGARFATLDPEEFVDFQVTTIPLGRVGTTDEIAKVVVFLASDDSSFVNGIELFADGGMAQICQKDKPPRGQQLNNRRFH